MLASAQVVDVIAARIMGATAAGSRVFTGRGWPLAESELPAWVVSAETEEVEPADIDGIDQHILTVRARGVARATADIDDTLHALAASGLSALFAPPVPYGLQLRAIDRDLAEEGEAAVGAITLTMSTLFFVAPSTPETIYS